MSIGAINELNRIDLEKFQRMASDIPKSERKEIITVFEKYVKVLEAL